MKTRNSVLCVISCVVLAVCSNPPPSKEDVLIAGSAQALRHMMRNPDSFARRFIAGESIMGVVVALLNAGGYI